MTRALVDTNLLISALLSPYPTSPPGAIVGHALAGTFQILVSETTLQELRDKTATKPYLSLRISGDEVERLAGVLANIGLVLPEVDDEIPELSRDRKDDYLLHHAMIELPDYVVSGDKDLLVLEEIAGVRIVSPAEFVAILEEAGAQG